MAACASNLSARYHIWFQPKGQLLRRLQSEVDRLSSTYGSPSWEPHVTFVPRFVATDDDDAHAKAKTIAAKLKNFKIRFSEPRSGPEDERSIALVCERDAALNEAISAATQVLGVRAFNFPPVITLMLAPESVTEEKRHELMAEETERLFRGSDKLDTWFETDTLNIFFADPSDSSMMTWNKLAEVQLGK